jgi:hypothetical protein
MAALALAIGVAWAEGAPAAGGPEKVAKGEHGPCTGCNSRKVTATARTP